MTITRRKKSFLSICLAIMLVLNYILPSSVFAADYTVRDGDGVLVLSTGEVLQAGDKLVFEYYSDEVTHTAAYGYEINYHYIDGTVETDESFGDSGYATTVDVRDYTEDYQENFLGWYVYSTDKENTETEGEYIYVVDVRPVLEFAISYELDGGSNSVDNPTTYKYGVGVDAFADASKKGYDFKGWYSDAEFSQKVEGISDEATGDKVLYAKFEVSKYNINYETNGGDLLGDNPTEYTYGSVIDEFFGAEKDGFTFDGWFLDAGFTEEFTGISADTTGDITLYAKYTENKSDDLDDDDDTDDDDDDSKDDDDDSKDDDDDSKDDDDDSKDDDDDSKDDDDDSKDDDDDSKDDDDDSKDDDDDSKDDGDDSKDDGDDSKDDGDDSKDDGDDSKDDGDDSKDDGDDSKDDGDDSKDDGDDDSKDDAGDDDSKDDAGDDDSKDDADDQHIDDDDAADKDDTVATDTDADKKKNVKDDDVKPEDKPFDYKNAEAATGDRTPLKLCIALLGVSALMIVLLLFKKKRKDDSDEITDEKTE
ncbi:MAG: InlB B-repeat-containing protein [Eubacterium sp.]|nr:InlB B-repeat-containing protein [Eubacterium sp.]